MYRLHTGIFCALHHLYNTSYISVLLNKNIKIISIKKKMMVKQCLSAAIHGVYQTVQIQTHFDRIFKVCV